MFNFKTLILGLPQTGISKHAKIRVFWDLKKKELH